MHINITVVTFKTGKVQPGTQKCFALHIGQVTTAGVQVSPAEPRALLPLPTCSVSRIALRVQKEEKFWQ